MSHSEIVYGVVILVLVYLILLYLYREIYKVQRWKSEGARIVLRRTRVFVYLTLIVFAVKIVDYALPGVIFHKVVGQWIGVLLLCLVIVVVVEAATSAFFEYFVHVRRHLDVPAIFHDLSRIVLYIVAFTVVLKAVLQVDVTPLLTGSAIISVVIGLALQESLGNLFSGIFLHGSKPFSRGDWVAFDEKQGTVEKVDWRATAIRTIRGEYIIVPNSSLAKMQIANFTQPSRVSARVLTVGAHYRHPPARVRKLLIHCALRTDKVLPEPKPVSRLIQYGDSSIVYDLKFWINDYGDRNNIDAAVMEKIWYAFKREGIEIPYPVRTVYMHQGAEGEEREAEEVNLTLLKRIDFLKDFSEEDRRYLASRLRVLTYSPGEPIIHQGEPGNSFYIVKEGKVQIQARDPDGNLFLTRELTKGQFFGEISLLTGEPRTATVVAMDESDLLLLDKEAFRKIVEDNPRAQEIISEVIARRQEYSTEQEAARSRLQTQAEENAANSKVRQQMIKRIRDFFSY